MLTSTLVSLSHGGTSHSHPTECSLHLPRYPISFSHSFPDRPASLRPSPATQPCSLPLGSGFTLESEEDPGESRAGCGAGVEGINSWRTDASNIWLVFLKSYFGPLNGRVSGRGASGEEEEQEALLASKRFCPPPHLEGERDGEEAVRG